MIQCLLCGKDTTNPKFCSRSCAAKYNNVHSPKRKPEGKCGVCGKPITTRNKYCSGCRPVKVSRNDSVRLCDLVGKRKYQRNSQVRELARKTYRYNNKPKTCIVCGYEKHIDVCHIRAISDFPETTLIGVINHPDNLIGLCKNHHWELDNGHLSIDDI